MFRRADLLLIHAGGTVGMRPTERGFAPSKGYLAEALRGMPQFCEPDQPLYTMPPSWVGKRIRYDIHEFDTLLDSVNMGPGDWAAIADTIGRHYDEYDGFVVLHGTDTAAYTASALSFMLDGLAKPVILTGSQIPISQLRNDAHDNLLGALLLAGHYVIPEVALYFNRRLLRGNRVRKIDAHGLNAFESGNYPPLANVGIDIEVDWHRVRSPRGASFQVRTEMDPNVSAVRLFPGLSVETLRNLLRPPLRGVVIEAYGVGNAPDNRPDFLNVLREASEAGMVIVATTQCHKGRVRDSYAAGTALAEAGVISGGDMTPEAALTKLSHVLALPGITPERVKRLMQTNLRGELSVSEEPARFELGEADFIHALTDAFRKIGGARADNEMTDLEARLFPLLLCAAAKFGDTAQLQRLMAQGSDINAPDYDGRTALHVAVCEGLVDTVTFLLQRGANVSALDRWNHSPIDDAVRLGHESLASLLREYAARQSGLHPPRGPA